MKKFTAVLLLFISGKLIAQNCSVTVDALKGTYQGDCKDNKANGTGTAKGEDEYTGEFKNGYPEGQGVYKWKNGDWFVGGFKKGKKEGSGTLHFHSGNDSVQKGFWRKDNYAGLYEHPFIIRDHSTQLTQIDARKENGGLPNIVFATQSVSGGSLEVDRLATKAAITDINILTGSYSNMDKQDYMSITSITTLKTVEFPFRARIYYGTYYMDIEFLEAGSWHVDVKVQR